MISRGVVVPPATLAFHTLTPHLRDIVRMVKEGERNGTIAHVLGVGEKTVRTQLSSIYTKLGLYGIRQHPRVVLAVAASRQGLG